MTTYRAVPVSQRDGSSLANTNCRMASIATGLDYESAGIQVSNGAEMRSRQSDQSGGTDSGDAAEAWASYGQTLRIRDGATWADAEHDLEAGRLVHLDVWAASAAGPCLVGDGGYGHTIAVAPEQSRARVGSQRTRGAHPGSGRGGNRPCWRRAPRRGAACATRAPRPGCAGRAMSVRCSR